MALSFAAPSTLGFAGMRAPAPNMLTQDGLKGLAKDLNPVVRAHGSNYGHRIFGRVGPQLCLSPVMYLTFASVSRLNRSATGTR